MILRTTLSAFFAVGLTASVALAIPAPMSPEDIEAASDLVIEGEVMDVTCVGEAEVTEASITQGYASTVAITATLKGSADETVDILFDAVEWLSAPPLCSTVDLTHLRGEKGTYSLVGTEVEGYRLTAAGGFVEAPDSTPDDDLPVCTLVDDPDGGATGGEDAGSSSDTASTDDTTAPEDVGPDPFPRPESDATDTTPEDAGEPIDDLMRHDGGTTAEETSPSEPAVSTSDDGDDGCMAGPASSPLLALGMLAWIGRRRRRR